MVGNPGRKPWKENPKWSTASTDLRVDTLLAVREQWSQLLRKQRYIHFIPFFLSAVTLMLHPGLLARVAHVHIFPLFSKYYISILVLCLSAFIIKRNRQFCCRCWLKLLQLGLRHWRPLGVFCGDALVLTTHFCYSTVWNRAKKWETIFILVNKIVSFSWILHFDLNVNTCRVSTLLKECWYRERAKKKLSTHLQTAAHCSP